MKVMFGNKACECGVHCWINVSASVPQQFLKASTLPVSAGILCVQTWLKRKLNMHDLWAVFLTLK